MARPAARHDRTRGGGGRDREPLPRPRLPRRQTARRALASERAARAQARDQAVALWKHASAAARENDCATVHELEPKIRDLDLEFHGVVFWRDVAIVRCMGADGVGT